MLQIGAMHLYIMEYINRNTLNIIGIGDKQLILCLADQEYLINLS